MQRQIAHTLLLSACLLLSLACSAQANSIIVDTTDDVIANDGACSLREAIINANNNDQSGSTDCNKVIPTIFTTIEFDAALAGATITLNGSQLPTITKTLFITGPVEDDPAGLVIDANQNSRIFNAEGSAPGSFQLILTGLTLTGGRTTLDGSDQGGGAVRVDKAKLNAYYLLIEGNATEGEFAHGGGLFINDGELMMEDSAVVGNSTAGFIARGGGIRVNSTSGGAALTRVTITDNHTEGTVGAGGGILAQGGHLQLIDSTVADNATYGAAATGGGLWNSGSVTLIHSTVSGNQTTGNVYLGGSARGGGIFLSNGDATLTNSTVSGNATLGYGASGGGIYSADSNHSLTLQHSTVAFNSSADGAAGIHNDQSSPNPFDLHNSLIVQANVGEVACFAAADTVAYSLATDVSCTGSATMPGDLNLLPLADNGGFTQTHAFFEPSVLLDTAGDCYNNLSIFDDQRGEPRPATGSIYCDIGAFELQGPIKPVLEIAPALLDLGTVPVGQASAPQTLTLTSSGNTAVEVQAVDTPGVPFSLTGGTCPAPPFSLDPVQSCTLEYTFAPAGTGVTSEMLQITSDDPASPHGFELSGEGQTLSDEIFTDRFEQ